MNISIDYDETYTRDPQAWDQIIDILKNSGHKVYCVTMRSDDFPGESLEVCACLNGKVDAIFFTSGRQKSEYMYDMGINIHVWIDDMPGTIVTSYILPF